MDLFLGFSFRKFEMLCWTKLGAILFLSSFGFGLRTKFILRYVVLRENVLQLHHVKVLVFKNCFLITNLYLLAPILSRSSSDRYADTKALQVYEKLHSCLVLRNLQIKTLNSELLPELPFPF